MLLLLLRLQVAKNEHLKPIELELRKLEDRVEGVHREMLFQVSVHLRWLRALEEKHACAMSSHFIVSTFNPCVGFVACCSASGRSCTATPTRAPTPA